MSWDWNYDPRGDLSERKARWDRERHNRDSRIRGAQRWNALQARHDDAVAAAGLPDPADRRGPHGRPVSDAQLVHLAKVCALGGRNAWRNVDAATRRTILSQRRRQGWAHTPVEKRRAVAVALAHARWHRLDPPPIDPTKIGPAGGVYR